MQEVSPVSLSIVESSVLFIFFRICQDLRSFSRSAIAYAYEFNFVFFKECKHSRNRILKTWICKLRFQPRQKDSELGIIVNLFEMAYFYWTLLSFLSTLCTKHWPKPLSLTVVTVATMHLINYMLCLILMQLDFSQGGKGAHKKNGELKVTL